MTLTELKYVVAVARERHFGRAAEACFVSQPTLSVAIRKLEEELGVSIFERSSNEVSITPIGVKLVEQAQKILEESANMREIASFGHDPLSGPLKVGVIYTIGPYILPYLVPEQIKHTPQMPLLLQENYTDKLLELLRQGEIDCAIVALPIPELGFLQETLYEESFFVAVPYDHPWSQLQEIKAKCLKDQTILLLGAGHCFRDHVLQVCPELAHFSASQEGIQRTFEGSSLETIRHMVAAGLGITVMPSSAIGSQGNEGRLLKFIPFSTPTPKRRVVLLWRKSFPRQEAITAFIKAIRQTSIPGIKMLFM